MKRREDFTQEEEYLVKLVDQAFQTRYTPTSADCPECDGAIEFKRFFPLEIDTKYVCPHCTMKIQVIDNSPIELMQVWEDQEQYGVRR